jgi:hypothetical protein
MKSAMKENQRETEKAKPEVATHPGLGPSHTPYWKLLAQAQQSHEEHEQGTDDSVGQS